ncbi:MAG: MATE family efflux transporter [Nostocoides sp.]
MGKTWRQEILRLAVPAFLALVIEPLFLLTDSAIVGHLGTAQLAGLGVASAVLLTAVNIFVFLAYATTSVVARQIGAGSTRRALEAGVDGLWLAIGLGVLTAVIVDTLAGQLSSALGATGPTLTEAVRYLRIAAYGIPGMLVVLATTGVLRGLQDTRTPLLAAVLGFGVNIVLNLWFVLGLGMGIAGSALGTAIAQTGMGLALGIVLAVKARSAGASLRSNPAGVLSAARGGAPLLVRTLALRAWLVLTTWLAAGFGVTVLASHQVVSTVWSFLSFALDALAIAGQAITGRLLGAADTTGAREATTVMVRWGVGAGVVLGLATAALHTVLPAIFTTDPAVRSAVAAGLLVVAIQQPLTAYIFVADGILIGAGDGRWLAGAMALALVAYLPALGAIYALAHTWDPGPDAAIVLIWLGMSWFLLVRGALMGWRLRRDTWMVTGAD